MIKNYIIILFSTFCFVSTFALEEEFTERLDPDLTKALTDRPDPNDRKDIVLWCEPRRIELLRTDREEPQVNASTTDNSRQLPSAEIPIRDNPDAIL